MGGGGEKGREKSGRKRDGGGLTHIQTVNKSSCNNNKRSFHVVWLINQPFLTWETRVSFLLLLSCLSCGRLLSGSMSHFMLVVYVFIPQGFRYRGLHWGLMRVRPSLHGPTISVKVSSDINRKQKGAGSDFQSTRQRHMEAWRCRNADTSFLSKL